MSTQKPHSSAFIRFFSDPFAMDGLNVAFGVMFALALFSCLGALGDLPTMAPVPLTMFVGFVSLFCWVMHKRDKKQRIEPVTMTHIVAIGAFLMSSFWITATPSLLTALYGSPIVVLALPVMVAHLIVTQVRFGRGSVQQSDR